MLFRLREEQVRGIIGTLRLYIQALPFARAVRYRDRRPIHENQHNRNRRTNDEQWLSGQVLFGPVYYVFYKIIDKTPPLRLSSP